MNNKYYLPLILKFKGKEKMNYENNQSCLTMDIHTQILLFHNLTNFIHLNAGWYPCLQDHTLIL